MLHFDNGQELRRQQSSVEIYTMTDYYFYGDSSDFETILKFVFAEGTCRVFEAYSVPEHELREFHSWAEVAASWQRKDTTLSERWSHIRIWPVVASKRVRPRRIELSPSANLGTHRFELTAWGLITLQLNDITADGLRPSRIVCSTEKRAMKWAQSYPEELPPTDWN